MRNFASELEREKISQRTHEHLKMKARRGLNVGGRVYGYDNLEVKDGDRRVRVEYRINPVQADFVREVFLRSADGDGLRTIAKDLNARRMAAPRAGLRGTGSWAPSTLHAMLRRDRYRGILVWGKKEKAYGGGTKVRIDRVETDWTSIEVPELRIVDDALWAAVASRSGERERLTTTPRRGLRIRYFLSGIARCAEPAARCKPTTARSRTTT